MKYSTFIIGNNRGKKVGTKKPRTVVQP